MKRVIGLPGDRVSCCDDHGRVQVNGHPLQEEDYLYRLPDGQTVKPSEFDVDVTVPAGRIFVMGDHRDNSAD
ncbi:signal peptidase I [Luteococcus peritonei]|uniref:Signal peptidase I n=1 Tax=Luteococcus peritonei TaxID=88874 RepID=A0ABW4RY08_9ACTN